MKKIRTIVTASFLSLAMTSSVLAGTWQPQAAGQWKYQNDDGSYATGWFLDDGKYYYLDEDGTMLADTRTPDRYYVDASGVWDGQPPAAGVIAAGEFTPKVGFTTSSPSTVYQPGIYQVGVDIPAGEYVLFALSEDSAADYQLRTDTNFSNYGTAIDGSEFDYNSIVLLENGHYLQMTGCTASPIGQVPQLDSSQASMYKIGYHIPAGTYRLHAKGLNDFFGYAILSFPTVMDMDAVLELNIAYEEITVTVEDGQYLLMENSILAEGTSGSASTSNDTSSSDTAPAVDTKEASTSSGVVTAGVSERLSAVTSTPATVYPAGIYEVGVSIPAGEYVVLSSPGEKSSYYEIRTNPDFESYDDMVDSCAFAYNSIIRLEDGQFLGLEDCSASPIAEVPQISFMEGQMFKAGYHIPAGTYRLRMTENPEDYGVWFILSAPTNNADVVLSQANIYEGADVTVTLTEGQYLQLIDCCIAE